MLAANAEDLAGDYELSQIEFKLGFTAAGTVVFIAPQSQSDKNAKNPNA